MSADRLAALERMVGNRPDDLRLRFGLALEYLNAGRLDEGIRELEVYLSGSDDEGNGWARLGAALLQRGREDEARQAYRRGIEAAARHGHPSMAEELTEALEGLTEAPEGPGP